MATFFQKITGGEQDGEPRAEAAVQKMVSRPRTRISTTPEPTRRVRISDEETQMPEPEESAEPEEEGELTVDIYDQGDFIVIQSTVAGVKPEDLDVSITHDSVTVRGRREKMEDITDENYYYKELYWGAFSRSVILPEEIEPDEAEAILKHGLLTVRLPKKKKNVIQKLKVKAI